MVVEAGDDRGDLTKVIEVEVVLVFGEVDDETERAIGEWDQRKIDRITLMWKSHGNSVGSVPEPFSLSVDLNIKSPKCNLAEDKFSLSQLKTSSAPVLQSETEEGISKSFSSAWLTIPS
ncbi:hypothetical protein Tco_0500046 [Tanacetum coccineum]